MVKNLNLIQDLDIKNKRVLYRVDLNLPMHAGVVLDNTRLTEILPTLNYLIENNCKIILLSHFGRPNGKYSQEYSLHNIMPNLENFLNPVKIFFANNIDEARANINLAKENEIILLENVRFNKGEESNDVEFAHSIANLGEIYINDAFSCSHRAHATIDKIATILPSAAGFLMQKELANIKKFFETPNLPSAAIVGGAKISTKLALLKKLVKANQLLIVGGAMANNFLKANGVGIGKSLYEPNLVDEAKNIIKLAHENNCELILPIDVITTDKIQQSNINNIQNLTNIEGIIADLGPKTIELIQDKLKNIKTLFWNGPLGVTETPPFDIGTNTLIRYIAGKCLTNDLNAIVGGGDIIAAINNVGMLNSFTAYSTAGGAFLEMLEGKTLPGVKVLTQ